VKRIIVVGSCGSGKSVFSTRLAEITGLPLIHLDRHFWHPGWIGTPEAEWDEKITELVSGESWIIDGNYSRTMGTRLARADTAIFLDFPRGVCTFRVIKRAIAGYGRVRYDLAEGCPGKIDLPFIKWTWDFPKRSRLKVIELLRRHQDRVDTITLRNNREIDAFLESIKK
jgi:adenylate kinase family enzyme